MKSTLQGKPESLKHALKLSRKIGYVMICGIGVALFCVVLIHWFTGNPLLSAIGVELSSTWIHVGLVVLVVMATSLSLSVEPSLLNQLRANTPPSSDQEVNRNHYAVLQQRTVTQLTIAETIALAGVVAFLLTGSPIDLFISLVPAGYLFYRNFPSKTNWFTLLRSEGIEPQMEWSNTTGSVR